MTGRLTRRPGGPARLRALLESAETIVAPGAFDPLAARLVEEAGFPAVYMTGFGTSAALLGRPDVGLLTMTEMAGNAARIAGCVDIPVIADADTGYGNALNVIRTVGTYEAAGVAGIHIEDQVAPKKCGHMEGKLVIPAEEMAAKVRAAVEARSQPEFVIIARTDARAVEGLDRALDRARRYRDAGADVLFIEALGREAEVEQAARRYRDDNTFLVNIEPNVSDTIRHDPSPVHEARHRPTRRNPRYLHTVRRVAPYSGGHVV